MPRTRAATPSTRKILPLAKVYALLEPGPVVLLTTADQPHANIMTLSWQTMLEFEPPQIACVVSNGNHSFQGSCCSSRRRLWRRAGQGRQGSGPGRQQ